jgi:hypothetical protein
LTEVSKIFFSETNELTEPKLSMNDHWNVLYQASVFYVERKVSEKQLEMRKVYRRRMRSDGNIHVPAVLDCNKKAIMAG